MNEESYQVCKTQKLLGSRLNTLRAWNPGDILVIMVDKKIAGLAKVASKSFESDLAFWKEDVFPYRVKLEFIKDWPLKQRRELNNTIKGTIMENSGPTYSWVFLIKHPMTEDNSEIIYKEIINNY